MWLLARDATSWKNRLVVAADGKTMRGARTNDTTAPHLLAALTRSGIIAGQHQIPAKNGEIAALPVLIESLPGRRLAGAAIGGHGRCLAHPTNHRLHPHRPGP